MKEVWKRFKSIFAPIGPFSGKFKGAERYYYDLGNKAYYAGVSIHDCPFPEQTYARQLWLAGYKKCSLSEL